VKSKRWIILAILLLIPLALAGCGVPHEGVDVTATPPEGFWQTFVVWPLANILIGLDSMLEGMGIPYSWGWSIILFTLIIKIVTFPLNLSQIRGMQAQKELQPLLAELQKKYGKDRERLAQEQMKLYKEAGVNPLSGCLPLLIQMPILFGLYAALVAVGPMLKDSGFFWIPDLSFPNFELGLSWIADLWSAGEYGRLLAYFVLPVLLIVSQIFMQKWMTPSTGDSEQAKMMQNMSLFMTLFFGYFTLQVPAGLSLYWVTSNLLQILQQWAVTRFFLQKPQVALATAGGDAKAADTATTDIKTTDVKKTAEVRLQSSPSVKSAPSASTSPKRSRPKRK
jgi:YidC/Oxa1 family membrane protein insertase